MLSVTKQGYSTASNNTTHNVPYPTSISNGDLLLLFLALDGNPSVTLPAGWVIQSQGFVSNKGVFATKRADGTETGNFTVILSTNIPIASICYNIHGSINTPQFIFEADNYSGDPIASLPISLNWEPVETVFISTLAGFQTGSITVSSYPSGYTDTEYRSSSSGSSALAGAYKIATQNSETPGTYDLSTNCSGRGFTVAVVELVIQSVTPDTTPVNSLGSTTITVAGVLDALVDVLFDGVSSPSIIFNNAQSVTAVFPVETSVQDIDIKLENSDGTEVTRVNGFSYIAEAPNITEVNPAGSGLNIETSFTITGTNFENGATVEIDGEACTDIVFVDSEHITATCPISLIQKLAILTVENPDGQQAYSNFYYMEEIPLPPNSIDMTAKFTVEAVGYSN